MHRPDAQLVLVDTPGLHKPRTLLGQRLNDLVRETYASVDVVCFCVTADDKIGPGDTFIAAGAGAADDPGHRRRDQDRQGAQGADRRAAARGQSRLGDWADVVPVSAVSDFQVDLLADLLVARLPEGPALYPDGELTDEPEQVLVAELIREAALEGVRDELPHSIAVTIEEMSPREGRPTTGRCSTSTPPSTSSATARRRSSSVPAAARLKEVGTTARAQIEALLGTPVYLDLRVKVAKDWQRDPRQLRKLGF